MSRRMHTFGLYMNIICNIIICGVMTFLVMKLAGAPITPINVFVGTYQSFFVGYFIGDNVPGIMWGNMLCAKLKLGKVGTYLLSNLVHCFCMVSLISLLVNLEVVGFNGAAIAAFVGTYIPVMCAAYAVMLVIMGPVGKLCMALTANIED